MEFRNLSGPAIPPVRGHYSHAAVLENGLVLLSGQKAWLPETGVLLQGGIASQTEQIFSNVEAILRGLDLPLSSIVRVSCHLANIDDYAEFNETYQRRLGDHRPARTVLGGYRLREGALVELVFEAYRGKR